jgi:hypothetical protein
MARVGKFDGVATCGRLKGPIFVRAPQYSDFENVPQQFIHVTSQMTRTSGFVCFLF